MTSFSYVRRTDYIAADEFEARIERAFVKSETVYVLDNEIVFRMRDGRIEASDDH